MIGQNVAATKWFREARGLRSGDDYVAGDVENQALARQRPGCDLLRQRPGRRQGNGRPIGVLAIHFDWEAQARAIVQGVRVNAADRARVLLVDSNFG